MTEDAPPEPAARFDSMLPGSTALPAMQMWQGWLKLGTAWWNGMISVWWPEHPFHQAPVHQDPHGQVIAPEPAKTKREPAPLA
ncbi:hypothetical protein GCM10009087_01160 [Sphingomonas oligophenolica]|uniref:Uncharacterized protein n=1 Tax=Sphingomonas oligophenolica TaxID=301154 RepID=A0ABU9Y150_9SPHN